jgi:putative ABC transport system substrate-binding protein
MMPIVGAMVKATAATAQPGGKHPRIGILTASAPPPPPTPQVDHLVQRLRELGYEDGKTAVLDIRYGANSAERVGEQAVDLVRQGATVIATIGDLSTRAAQRATTTVPIVANVGFAVQSGFVSSLARPGGNITGVSVQVDEVIVKRMELLKQVVPRMAKVAFLWDVALNAHQLRVAEDASKSLTLQFQTLSVRTPGELPGAFEAAARGRADAVLLSAGPMLGSARDTIVAHAAKHRLPTAYFSRDFVEAGGLMSYGVDWSQATRLWAEQVARVLKGAGPAELPVLQPTQFTLVVNLRTARTLGLSLPASMLQRADEVIQ